MTTELIRSPLHILKCPSVLSLMMNGRKEKLKKDLIHELEEEYKLLPGFKSKDLANLMIDGVMDKNSRGP